ncbi:SH3 domain-containing protein [Streptomyces sp. NBC_01198]|uniref:SH3 domain-containing protein n=1 Tax=Streptomyces sp. NBC_01198 TaxID=2903769 RepID=UPI002E101CB9|nr:SH3 domain-containing protein [Streptomyces sp. NBC_01198]
MQLFGTSKLIATVALTAGAAALSVLGAAPAGASPTGLVPASVRAAAPVDGRVVSNLPLTIRSAATTNSTALGSYAPGTIVHLTCKKNGQVVDGNPRWYKLSDRTGWLAARYVLNLGTVPWC